MDPKQDVSQMLDDMVAGFDGLMGELKKLRAQNAAMQQQLDAAREKRQPNTPSATEVGEEGEKKPEVNRAQVSDSEDISLLKAEKTMQEWKTRRKPVPPKIELPDGHPHVEYEQDFTTPGSKAGKLGCPFAGMMKEKEKEKDGSQVKMGRKGRRPGEPSLTPSGQVRDPIAAEFHSSSGKSQEQPGEDFMPKCPIRFLDQHKPEEVAQYFEKHKHEIPRSHQLCIRRYQSNEQSIRELDAKYGSLVSMVHGLGKKHQPMLEDRIDEEGEDDLDDDASQNLSDKEIAKIQSWAGGVKGDAVVEASLEHQLAETNVATADDERKTRFDEKLREVRLGESPSRPWGIQVPAEAKLPKPKEEQLHQTKAQAPETSGAAQVPAIEARSKPASSVTFNGPVFLGYSADDVAQLLRQFPQLGNAAS